MFLANISTHRPQLLIFDGHDSHNYVELIEAVMKEYIILVELPANTSHWLQPLDRTVFYSLKSHYNEVVRGSSTHTLQLPSQMSIFVDCSVMHGIRL